MRPTFTHCNEKVSREKVVLDAYKESGSQIFSLMSLNERQHYLLEITNECKQSNVCFLVLTCSFG